MSARVRGQGFGLEIPVSKAPSLLDVATEGLIATRLLFEAAFYITADN
jgi:hypothetical protein